MRIQLGTAASNAANSCLVYNYYPALANPTSCAIPAQSGGNVDAVVGYFYQDNANPSLNHTTSYVLDSMLRLTSSVATGSSRHNLTFSYDRYGNMTCTTNASTNGPCPNWSFNTATNQITTSGFTYDLAGNLTQDPSNSPTNTYQWDAEGRLSKVVQGATTYSIATYNAFGQVVETFYPGFNAKVEGLFDPFGQELGYYDGVGNSWWDRDIIVGGRMIAQSYPTATYFLHANRLHSDTQLTDQSGVKMDLLYYPWGQIWTKAGSLIDAHFAAFQQGAGIFYTTPTRSYSNTQGRWLSSDPVAGSIPNPQSLNRYAYVENSPCSATDPLGLFIQPPRPPKPPPPPDLSFFLEVLLNSLRTGPISPDPDNLERHRETRADGTGPCNENNPTNAKVLDFIRANLAAANKLAAELHDPVQDVLGLSAEESGKGLSAIAVNAHNFFGLHAGAPGNIGIYTTLGGATVSKFSAQTGFLDSGQAFVDLYKGAVTGATDPTKFAQALVQAGFNTGKAGTGNPNFVPLVSGTIGGIQKRLNCPQLDH